MNDPHIDAIERLIALMNPTAEGAAAQVEEFREALADADEDCESGDDLMGILNPVVDWKTGFYVDWKDTPSFIDSIDTLCEAWGVRVDWGVEEPAENDDFLKDTDVPSLLKLAHAALLPQGLTLWSWDTQGDCYSGLIARSSDDAAVLEVSKQLQVEFRPGERSF